MIRIENLHKQYGYGDKKIDVLKGLDLTLEDEKLICVLGPSGSGKSTLLNILGGIETIDKGRVEVLGKDLATMKKKELEAYLVTQSRTRLSSFTISSSSTDSS